MTAQKEPWDVNKIRVAVITALLMCILGCIAFIYFTESQQQNERNAEAIKNEMAQPTLPKYSVRSKINPTQYLKIDLPQAYLNKSYPDDEFDKNHQGNRYESLSVDAILEIEDDKVRLRPYGQQKNDSSGFISIHVSPVSKTEKRFQALENKNFIVGYELNRPDFETPHLQAQLIGNYAMLLQPKNFKHSEYDPFYIRIGRGEKTRSSAMFRDSFSIATMIKDGQYMVKYVIFFSPDFIKFIRRGGPYQPEDATHFLERLFLLTSTANPEDILQISEQDLEAFVSLNNQVVGLIDKNSVVTQMTKAQN